MARLRTDLDRSAVRLDSTIGHAWRACPKRETDPVIGRSRAQIHSLTDCRGCPLGLCVTGGPRPDLT